MAGFDDILKKGKGAVSNQQTTAQSPAASWKGAIGEVIETLEALNALYGNQKVSHIISTECIRCYMCNKVSYVINVDDINNGITVLKFHSGLWKSVAGGIYYCDKCKSP